MSTINLELQQLIRGLGGAGARGVATAQLPPRAEVVVVGGGVAGASTAYHLARHDGR